MKTKDNKSANQWPHRLFKESGVTDNLHLHSAKTYFAHRYHVGHSVPQKNPFGDIFLESLQHQDAGLADTDGFHQVLEREIKEQGGTENISFGHLNQSYWAQNVTLSGRFTVMNSYAETLDTQTFRLVRVDGRLIDYLPGQYVTLTLEIAGQTYKRSYSLASAPTRPGIIEITVKRDPDGGVVSNWLNDHLKVGDSLELKGPYGKFTFAEKLPTKILFLAAGSGIVPIMSMLRWLCDKEANVDAVLLLSSRTYYDIIYSDELNLLAKRHSQFKFYITLTKEPLIGSSWSGLKGRITEKMLAAVVPDAHQRTVYLCGPEAYMDECRRCLQSFQVPAEQVFCESFTVISPKADEKVGFSQPFSATPARPKQGVFNVSFMRSGKAVTADGSKPLLELAESLGIYIDNQCRAGNCSECMVKCLSGQVEMATQAEIDDNDRKKGWVYSCCAYPASDLALDV